MAIMIIKITPIVVSGLYFNGLLIIIEIFLIHIKSLILFHTIAGVATVFNIIANNIDSKIGLYGAAYTTLGSYLIYFMLSVIIQWREIKEFIDYRLIIVSSILMFHIFIYINKSK